MPQIRIVCISDTHGQHAKLNVPDGDVLIHAGDWPKGLADLYFLRIQKLQRINGLHRILRHCAARDAETT